MTITDSLKTALAELAAVRASSVTLNETMHRAKAAFNEQHVELIHAINDHTARLAEAEEQVRTLRARAWAERTSLQEEMANG